MKQITTEWTGRYPNLCSGYWIIKIDNKEIIDNKNDDKSRLQNCCPSPYKYDSPLTNNMDTSGSYSSWHFTDDWDVETDDYCDGYDLINWLKTTQAKAVLEIIKDNGINMLEEDISKLYDSLQLADWRSGSCGGCI